MKGIKRCFKFKRLPGMETSSPPGLNTSKHPSPTPKLINFSSPQISVDEDYPTGVTIEIETRVIHRQEGSEKVR
jgi:hypothetical protein